MSDDRTIQVDGSDRNPNLHRMHEGGRCMAPQNPTPGITTSFCVYPQGHPEGHSWQDSAEWRADRMKREGWS